MLMISIKFHKIRKKLSSINKAKELSNTYKKIFWISVCSLTHLFKKRNNKSSKMILSKKTTKKQKSTLMKSKRCFQLLYDSLIQENNFNFM
jgi:hypothetical protein